MRWAAAGVAAALLVACGPADPPVQRVYIALGEPTGLDPTAVASVVVAAVHDPGPTCVVSAGSNTCAELTSIDLARKATGYVSQTTITINTGSSARLPDLPRGRTCFVAEARSVASSSLATGCADVTLELDQHVIEILLQ